MFLNQYHNVKTKCFLADSQLFIMGICYWLCMTTAGIAMTFFTLKNADNNIAIFFFLLSICVNIICLCTLPKWRIIVELSADGISYKPTFKKKIVKKYSDFGYFYCASYTYYTQKKFLVFSQRRLSDYELTHINNVPVSEKLIKIKVRKGLKEVLSPLLPPKYLFRIPKDFW